ncbi:MAG: hypothetical protein CfP315_0768 [Candidatus Improbicoccus pseudotrichonymphae]|uniref:Uncharacterized protein n=1 Tax=Candidatus Improbicoccus pseudotrichonymphae TaxID=3033792 RepID=A0AA48KZC9_9FIRM|nr:MAG: hypothetical protein CfP315_0768 [Candidatus Improbicoccus pseudotrichonymphae]
MNYLSLEFLNVKLSLTILLEIFFIFNISIYASGGKMSRYYKLEFLEKSFCRQHTETKIKEFEKKYSIKIPKLLKKIYTNELSVRTLEFYGNLNMEIEEMFDLDLVCDKIEDMREFFERGLFLFGSYGSSELFLWIKIMIFISLQMMISM